MKKRLIIIITALLVLIALPVIFTLSIYFGAFGHLQNRKELLDYRNATASVVLSSGGDIIGKFFAENRTNISYEQIPAHLVNALIATEDSRFYEHNGIDTRSIFRVLVKSILLNIKSSGGGSTITQQLAKNMFGRKNLGPLTIPVSKVKEIVLAHRLEKLFSKEEILTLYLNTVSFGENIYGIEAASERYFNKKTELLKVEESAALIGMLKANTFYNPHLHPENALKRRNIVLNLMEKYKYLKPSEADSLSKLPLNLNYTNIVAGGPADYFLVRVKNDAEQVLQKIDSATGKKWDIEEDGLVITTTLNLTLQKYALESFHDHLSVMQKRLWKQYQTTSGERLIGEIAERELQRLNLTHRENEINVRQIFDWDGSRSDSISVADSMKQALQILHAGLLAMDPVSGAVEAWVGGINFKSQPYDQIIARRQLASAFKPVLYAEALEEGIKPCQYIDNDSVILSGFGDWSPENYDHTYGGRYSVAGALVRSMNVPTFSLYLNVDFEKLDSLWKRMGFSFELNNNPSLALGTAEANIMEVAVAYSAFANGGYKISPQTIVSIKTPGGEIIYENKLNDVKERILTGRSSLLMGAMLQKAIMEGTGVSMNSVFGVNLPLAGKTGTSQNYADAWFAAFNPKLVIVSRVGASTNAVHFNNGSNGSGSTLALPLVALTLKKVQMNPVLRDQLIMPFPDLPPELKSELDCPDFKEDNFIDKFFDLFQKKKIDFDKEPKKAKPKKRSFFKRLFGRGR
ncbi:MAG TPA: transglycosylase domain-containing protein [Bacteroidales bacterium]|nr:transglycosylase domain-containing protein [Bacteroidales bacterium]